MNPRQTPRHNTHPRLAPFQGQEAWRMDFCGVGTRQQSCPASCRGRQRLRSPRPPALSRPVPVPGADKGERRCLAHSAPQPRFPGQQPWLCYQPYQSHMPCIFAGHLLCGRHRAMCLTLGRRLPHTPLGQESDAPIPDEALREARERVQRSLSPMG